ncbi:MAG: nickel pincer cofactor biosynthesis protein LarB [Deltaproteobacteria bacterium]|nr:nickel pincer cofactor biosynthesis protein LarB [Deltaproteobacteria bacterium]
MSDTQSKAAGAGRAETELSAAERALREFVHIDHDRGRRCGVGEVVFGQGKRPEEVAQILAALCRAQGRALATRVTPEAAAAVGGLLAAEDALPPLRYDPLARCLTLEATPPAPAGRGEVLVLSAGTSDGAVAAEAARVLEFLGHRAARISDVGVAGLHRLLGHLDRLRAAEVIIACAGMEGALPSVVAGLVECPVIAVPTSVGYGAHLGGLAPLLNMLTSCAAGVVVVNIDNGFGAAYAAAQINRRAGRPE